MKRFFLLLSTFFLCAGVARAQNVSHGPVTKITSGADKNKIDEDLIVGAGRTLAISGGTLDATGATLVGIATSWAELTGKPTTLAAAGLTDGVNDKVDDANVTAAISGHTLTLGWAGQLSVARGGTGAATLTGVLLGNGTSAFTAATLSGLTLSAGTLSVNAGAGLPSQTGHAGAFLSTDGSTLSWTASALVMSVSGTAGQITANTVGNAVTLSLPSALTGITSIISSGNLALNVAAGSVLSTTTNQNAATVFQIANADTGNSAHAQLKLTSATGSAYIGLGGPQSGFPVFGLSNYLYAIANATGLSGFAVHAQGTSANRVLLSVDGSGVTAWDYLNVNSTLQSPNEAMIRFIGANTNAAGGQHQARGAYYYTATTKRWAMYIDDMYENGADAVAGVNDNTHGRGSNFWLTFYNDAGAYASDTFVAYRETGDMIFGMDPATFPVDLGAPLQVQGKTRSGASGIAYSFTVSPTYNMSGTSAATDFLINRTQTAVGSGAQLLADWQVAGASKFKVDTAGNVTAAGSFTGGAPTGGNGAAAWKPGTVRTSTGLAVSTTSGVQLDVGGTLVTLAVLTTNP